MVIGDVLRCLFVSCRLFLALVFVVNVLVWFFVDDDDNDEAVDGGARGRPVRENPEGQPSTNTTGSGRAPCVRSLCGFWACRRTAQPPPPPTPPPSRSDDESPALAATSAAASGEETLPTPGVVEEQATLEETEHDNLRSAADEFSVGTLTAGAAAEDATVDSRGDTERSQAQQAPAELMELDIAGVLLMAVQQLMMESDLGLPVPPQTTETSDQERAAAASTDDVDDEWIDVEEVQLLDGEKTMTSGNVVTADVTEPESQGAVANGINIVTVFEDLPKPMPRTPPSSPRRPASHW